MKSDFLRNMKNEFNLTTTENGAVNYKSTNNAMLDAFGSLGAMRFSDENDIIRIFSTAFYEDPEHATKLAFYIRDIRGGQGQRRVFRTILKWMASECPNVVINNISNILFYGRGDDYMCLLGTNVEFPMIKFIRDTLNKDSLAVDNGGECSLLAKWLPSENTSSPETVHNAKVLMKHLGMAPREYRKVLSKIRKYLNVTEVKMSGNQWGKINYEHVSAKASMNYSDAFFRHDREGYVKYLRELSNGKAKVNADSLFPTEYVQEVVDGKVVIKEKIDPVKVMLTTLDSERYSRVVTDNNLKTTVKGIKKS